jgi:prolyl oligopeptidase
LLDEGLTSSPRLAISGSSNGGLLVASVLTQRPELFGAACLGSPLTDMLRYHKFNFAHEWVSEYGSSESEEDCRFLRQYSPLHNVREATYPATFIQVGASDDRVDPLHSYKFAAELQRAQIGSAPIVVKTYERQGHTYACAPSWYGVDQLSFLAHAVGLTDNL